MLQKIATFPHVANMHRLHQHKDIFAREIQIPAFLLKTKSEQLFLKLITPIFLSAEQRNRCGVRRMSPSHRDEGNVR